MGFGDGLADALFGEPALAQLAAFVFGRATPDTGLLVRGQREFEALVDHRALGTYGLCRVDLVDRESGGTDGEEQFRVGVSARSPVTPFVSIPLVGADPG